MASHAWIRCIAAVEKTSKSGSCWLCNKAYLGTTLCQLPADAGTYDACPNHYYLGHDFLLCLLPALVTARSFINHTFSCFSCQDVSLKLAACLLCKLTCC